VSLDLTKRCGSAPLLRLSKGFARNIVCSPDKVASDDFGIKAMQIAKLPGKLASTFDLRTYEDSNSFDR
jgi:hypothetical protein